MKKNEDKSVEAVDKTTLKWRLSTKPTLDDVTTMLDKGIITQEEARQILFSEESTNDRIKELEEQVKMLQKIIDKLANQPVKEVIKYIERDWPKVTWINNTPNRHTIYGSDTSFGSGTVTLCNNVRKTLSCGSMIGNIGNNLVA